MLVLGLLRAGLMRARFSTTWPIAMLVLLASCGDEPQEVKDDMRLFRRSVELEDQLAHLAEIGITQNPGTLEKDLFMLGTKEELERNPYKTLAEVLGMEIEREPWTPISDRLWMCDFERIEDHGAYKDVVLRLESMTESALSLSGVRDYVDIEEGTAWVEFRHGDRTVRWDLKVDNDWLDPQVLVQYDDLLEGSGAGVRLYANFSDYGQVAFLAAFTPDQLKRFTKLTSIEMIPVE